MAIKGIALVIEFEAWDASTAPATRKTGDVANISCVVSKDGGNFAAATNSPTEVTSGGVGTGVYKLSLTATEMEANDVVVLSTSATSDIICTTVQVVTETNTDGYGANTVTITVTKADATPIPTCTVNIRNSGDTLTVTSGETDANGQVVFYIDDGSYLAYLEKNAYSFTTPETLTVSGTTTDTYIGAAVAGTTYGVGPAASVTSIRHQFYETASAFVSDSEIKTYLWEGERDMNAFVECYLGTGTNTTTTGTQEYNISSFVTNCIGIRHISYDGTALKRIDLRDLDFLDEDGTTTDAQTGDPTSYYEWNDKVGLWPVPDASATVKIWGVFEPPEITSATTSYSVPRQFQTYLHDYALYRMYLKDQDDGRANMHNKLWNEHKQEAQRLWARKYKGNKLMTVKDSGAYPKTVMGMR